MDTTDEVDAKPKVKQKVILTEEQKLTVDFIDGKKKSMKKWQYRERFDNLANEVDGNLVNTGVQYGQKLYEKSGWGSFIYYNKMGNGAYDINVYPQKVTDRDQSRSGVPVSQEPIAFSKILIATSILAGKLPDAKVSSDSKIYSKTSYELWKRTWTQAKGNGSNTLMMVYQNLFTYGWAAWRVYPRRVQVKRKGVPKILFDDIYREPLDPRRTWLGVGFNNGDFFSRGEVYYEKDIPKDVFFKMYPNALVWKTKLDYCQSEEAKDSDGEMAKTHVTIGYYENVLENRFAIKCGKFVIYDGEFPNDDSFGSVVVVRCFVRDVNDPYGVGLYELMRGNTAIYTYINSMNAQQVEAEIYPLLFGAQVQNGTATYKRGPNVVNPKTPGTDISVVNTKGNIQGGIAYANQQKTDIEENTGVNNIVAGQNSESTLGSTVILKEAAYNRLTPPRNSVVDGLNYDALIANSWIKQTYPIDKVFLINSKEEVREFVKQNPDYFTEAKPVMGNNGEVTKYAVLASPNLRLNHDFTPDGELLEDVPTRSVSARNLYKEMKDHGHMSDYIEFNIDPTSMLLPSIEIQKQTFMALYPVITNAITTIFSMRNVDPDGAASQLKALEKMLDIQCQNVYDFISKIDYDAIMAKQPSEAQVKMQQMAAQNAPQGKPPAETLNYKDAPEDVKREIEAQAGLKPSAIGGTTDMTGPIPAPPEAQANPGPGTGEPVEPGANMTQDGTSPLQPQNANEVPRPQSPLTSSFDASLGRAANVGGFPK